MVAKSCGEGVGVSFGEAVCHQRGVSVVSVFEGFLEEAVLQAGADPQEAFDADSARRMPACLQRCSASVLHRASTPPLPIGRPIASYRG